MEELTLELGLSKEQVMLLLATAALLAASSMGIGLGTESTGSALPV